MRVAPSRTRAVAAVVVWWIDPVTPVATTWPPIFFDELDSARATASSRRVHADARLARLRRTCLMPNHFHLRRASPMTALFRRHSGPQLAATRVRANARARPGGAPRSRIDSRSPDRSPTSGLVARRAYVELIHGRRAELHPARGLARGSFRAVARLRARAVFLDAGSSSRSSTRRAVERPCTTLYEQFVLRWLTWTRPVVEAVRRASNAARLRAISAEHLVALVLHQLLRARLEVQAEQRLGVRRAHVEVPVVRVDRHAVEVRDRALPPEPLLELLQLHGDVRDRCVELAGEEVALAVRREELGQLLPRLEISSSISRNGTTPESACEKSRK